jgi:hypothetical protein
MLTERDRDATGRIALRPGVDDNAAVRILIRDRQRRRLFEVAIDPEHPPTVVRDPRGEGARDDAGEVCLNWDQARDDQGRLRRCPVCGCRELYVRKDFHQVTGLAIVLLAAVVAMVLFGMRQVFTAALVLAGVVLLDVIIYFFSGRCLVCYRCRSEFRDTPIDRHHQPWDLSIGEKYRTAHQNHHAGERGP